MVDDAGLCAFGDEATYQATARNARPFSRSEAEAFAQNLQAAREREEALQTRPTGGVGIELRRASFEKWRGLHEWTRRHPYRDRILVRRPEQWREALEKFRSLRDRELIDWLALQIEVATNLDNSVQDMRPRDPGPTWVVTLQYIANRKRKALAVLHWAEAAERDGCFTVDSDCHAQSARILGREPTDFERGDGGHEGAPFFVERSR